MRIRKFIVQPSPLSALVNKPNNWVWVIWGLKCKNCTRISCSPTEWTNEEQKKEGGTQCCQQMLTATQRSQFQVDNENKATCRWLLKANQKIGLLGLDHPRETGKRWRRTPVWAPTSTMVLLNGNTEASRNGIWGLSFSSQQSLMWMECAHGYQSSNNAGSSPPEWGSKASSLRVVRGEEFGIWLITTLYTVRHHLGDQG